MMRECEWCGESFRPRARTSRFCSKSCAGNWQFRDRPRRTHNWGSRPSVDSAHRKMRTALLSQAIGRPCPLCGDTLDRTAELDHIVPRARGGRTEKSNCRILCKRCNRERGASLGGQVAKERRTGRQTGSAEPSPRRWLVLMLIFLLLGAHSLPRQTSTHTRKKDLRRGFRLIVGKDPGEKRKFCRGSESAPVKESLTFGGGDAP